MKTFNSKSDLIEAYAQHAAAEWAAERGNGDGTANIEVERSAATKSVIWTHPSVAHLIGLPAGWSITMAPNFGHAPA